MTAPRGVGTLHGRIAWLLTAACVLVGAVLVADGIALAHLVVVQRQVTGTLFDATTAGQRHMLSLVDAETGVRGYALTGDAAALAPYEAAVSDPATFAPVADMLDGIEHDQRLREAAAAADAAATAWFRDYAEPLVAQVRDAGTGSVTAAQIAAGTAQFDAVRSEVDAFNAEVGAVRRAKAAELDEWTRVAIASLVVMGVAGLIAGALAWFGLRRWVVRPIDALAADSRAVASGHLDHRVTASGPRELADLGADVEAMRAALVRQVAAVERSRADLVDANARLTAQAQELERSNRDLEQFAYVASHDLQEPLRKVASFTQLLQKRYGGQLDERADQYIEFAVDGAKRMQRLIHDLLGFSRVGRHGDEVSDVPLDDVLARTLDDLGELVTRSGAVVTADPLPVVRGEAPLLAQLLANLLGNAIKFRAPDRDPRVHLSARRVGDEWEIECRDNGIGIDPRYAERVFVIFQRLHAKDVYEGTGIGLALCKKIVEFHGGRIWIGVPDGPGASIRWTLPAAGAPPVGAAQAEAAAAPAAEAPSD